MTDEFGEGLESCLGEIYQELAREHGRIMALVARLKALRTTRGLVPLLEELHPLLVDHFAREQFPGGFYEAMGATSAELRGELRVLVNEHVVILSSVRGQLERAKFAGEENAPEILRETANVIELLEAHEHKEHELADKLLGA